MLSSSSTTRTRGRGCSPRMRSGPPSRVRPPPGRSSSSGSCTVLAKHRNLEESWRFPDSWPGCGPLAHGARARSSAGTACDFLTVETAFVQRIYVLFFISLATRRIEYIASTSNTSSASTAAITTSTGRTARSTLSRPTAATRRGSTRPIAYGVAISSAASSTNTRPPEFANPTRSIQVAHVAGHHRPPCSRCAVVLYNSTTTLFILQGDVEMTLPHPLPDDLVELIARRFRAIGEPMRIRLLDQLRDGEATVGALSANLSASQQNVSKHLAVLADAGIIGRRKEGNHVYYRIVDDGVFALCEDVCGSVQEQLRSLSELVGLGGA